MPPVAQTVLDNDLIRTFVVISETGSFTQAAKQVLRTPSAVSMQMKRLEEQLGRPLFLREGRSVALTPDGEALLNYGRRIMRLNEEAVSRFLMPAVEGVVRFGAPDDFGAEFLPNILSRFATTHPLVEVNVVLAPSVTLIQELNEGRLDLTLSTLGMADQGPQTGQVIFTEPLVWVGVRGGAAKEAAPLPLALSGLGCSWRAAAIKTLAKVRRPYRVAYTCDNCQGQLAAVKADLAIAPLAASPVPHGYEILGRKQGFPEIGNYQVRLTEAPGLGAAGKAFAEHVIESFNAAR